MSLSVAEDGSGDDAGLYQELTAGLEGESVLRVETVVPTEEVGIVISNIDGNSHQSPESHIISEEEGEESSQDSAGLIGAGNKYFSIYHTWLSLIIYSRFDCYFLQ